MRKKVNGYDKTIQFCKICINPKTEEYVYGDKKQIYNTRYTVVVHYSIPKGDWDEFDV